MQQRRLRARVTLLTILGMAAAALALTPPTSGATAPTTAPAPAAADNVPPPGANDWSCTPDPRHPQPVVLVNGTFETMQTDWPSMSPYLAGKGYCVFAFNYGRTNSTGPIVESAHQLRRFVDRVRRATGRNRVDLVGHSQGGMMPRYYLRFLGGARHVDDLIGLSPSSHGTTSLSSRGVNSALKGTHGCRACRQQRTGSPFLRRLNRGGDTVTGVDYTVLVTRHDEVVTPYRSQYLRGPRSRVTNVLLQDRCPADPVEHVGVPNDPVAQRFVLDALRREGPARERLQPACPPAGS